MGSVCFLQELRVKVRKLTGSTITRLEVTIGIIAACIPAIRPLFRTEAEKRRSRRLSNRSNFGMPNRDAHRLKANQSSLDLYAADQALRVDDGRYQPESSERRLSQDALSEESLPSVPETQRIRKTTEFRLTSNTISSAERMIMRHDWGFDAH